MHVIGHSIQLESMSNTSTRLQLRRNTQSLSRLYGGLGGLKMRGLT
jgi:hypothetical protein